MSSPKKPAPSDSVRRLVNQHRVSVLRSLSVATLVLALGIGGHASSVKAEEAAAAAEKNPTEAETAPSESKKTSYELRFTMRIHRFSGADTCAR